MKIKQSVSKKALLSIVIYTLFFSFIICVAGSYIFYRVIIYIKKPGKGYARWENIAAYIVLAMTLVFWVVRNI